MATRRRRVVWALRARRAVDDALTYIADDSPQAAADLAGRVIERAESLATLSERGRIVPELADPSLRELIVAPYRLLYEVHGSGSGSLVSCMAVRTSGHGGAANRE
jgi:plasmid stabilization system protein ParE